MNLSNESVNARGTSTRLERLTLVTLVVTLVLYPAIRCMVPDPNSGTRADFWYFWIPVAVGHWTCFGIISFSLRRSNEAWTTIGVDWEWFRLRWPWLVCATSIVVAMAFFDQSSGPDAPTFRHQTTTAERLFMVFGIMTAGVVEETIFRGFALTRLSRLFNSPWLGLPITIVAFVFLHRVPESWPQVLFLGGIAAVFGIAFIIMKQRRLEILMCSHAGLAVLVN